MIPIEYKTGDATAPDERPAVIAHICNNRGAWGAGFVMALSARWSQPEAAYRKWSRNFDGNLPLGDLQYVNVGPQLTVVNMVAQDGFPTPERPQAVRYVAVGRCLFKLSFEWHPQIGSHPTSTVVMPRIGVGLGGGSWDRISQIIEARLSSQDIPVVVYDLP